MITPLRPLLFVPRYWPGIGGSELHSRRLAQELALHCEVNVARTCSTETIATDYAFAEAKPARQMDGRIPVSTIAPPGAWQPALRSLARLAETSRPARFLYGRAARACAKASLRPLTEGADVVHGIYNGFTPGVEALRSFGKPFVWTPLAHTTKPTGTAWSSPGFKRLYRKADALIAMTEYEREWLIAQGAQSSRVHVCPMAALFEEGVPDPAGFRTRYGIGDKPMVLFLGRTADYKGYRQLLDAAPAIWRRHRDVHIVFAGPVTDAASEAFAACKDPRLIIAGLVSGEEKKSALAACSMLCLPSTEESLGVVYLEAWSFEKPVIAADIPVMRSVIDAGADGLLVPQEAAPIAQAILQLLDNPRRAEAMGARGALKVDAEYNWARIAADHLKIYNAVL
ncbi:MAG: glycosyltransferase family 4 protein [Alphaproteobacteria bacterium]|nr:glycosyltransferase family 4 protein [Alphaproteobacteria bacterium]